MNRHLDDGAILTLRDGGLTTDDARRHVESCPVCEGAVTEAAERRARVQATLESLDPLGPLDLERAKARVRRRLDRRRDEVHRRPLFTTSLGRAAAILLLVSGVVYALPHTPIPDWIGRGAADGPEPPASLATPGAEDEGVEVPVPETGLAIGLSEVPVDLALEIRWVDGTDATVVAGPGARYSVAAGRAEASVSSGPVRMRLPRTGGPLIVEVNGEVALTRDGSAVEVRGAVLEQTEDLLIFTPGGP